ncbi:cation diffusion facilitator family transporter [Salidesulfovibrio onnuriiensis]|uniref:cation diffusion facilitator family transporter n=1 Tax=Salidesulfovibrio onnuriiensis TaxID=2583823 RepID=UPI0011CC1100|nr:cation diffusion facilitator family transporter [Salidesulfovibrio onnuriiensis]
MTTAQSPKQFVYYSIAASIITLALKFGAWGMTGSVGLLSDAAETVVNLTAGLIALTAISIALRPADKEHAYGHGKAEYFASGAEGILIMVAAVGIAWTAVNRFLAPQPLSCLGLGLGLALASSAINYITAKIMLRAARQFDSITLEADAKHLLTDVWTSIGLVAGLGILLIFPDWQILDPIIAGVMALNIIRTGVDLIKRSVQGLMDDALPHEELLRINDAILKHTDKGTSFHGLRTRKAGPRRFIDFHLLVDGNTTVKESHDLCVIIEEEIQKVLDGAQITIHVEPREDRKSWDGKKVGGLCKNALNHPDDSRDPDQ